MFLKEFILRFIKLEAEFVSVLEMDDNQMTFRVNDGSMNVIKDLKDLLGTIVPEEVGEFVVSVNFGRNGVTLKFVEAEC